MKTLAKPTIQPSKPSATKPSTNGNPKSTDARSELFWILGRMEGQGVEGAVRAADLVIDLTTTEPMDSVGE